MGYSDFRIYVRRFGANKKRVGGLGWVGCVIRNSFLCKNMLPFAKSLAFSCTQRCCAFKALSFRSLSHPSAHKQRQQTLTRLQLNSKKVRKTKTKIKCLVQFIKKNDHYSTALTHKFKTRETILFLYIFFTPWICDQGNSLAC